MAGAGPIPLAGVRTVSSSAALLGTVALLLLAMGVGVLIGTSGQGSTAPKVIVNGGGGSVGSSAGTAATSGSAGTSASASPGGASTKKGSRAAAAPVAKPGKISATSVLHPAAVNPTTLHTTAQRKKALTTTLKKTVPLSNGKKLAPETQKLGGSCSAGTVGCVNGKYTGQFF